MTDKEKKMLKDSIINIFENFNVLDHMATIGGLKNDILKFINSMQEEPVSDELEKAARKYATKEYLWQYGHECWDAPIKDFKAGAQWQKEKDQDAVEIAREETLQEVKSKLLFMLNTSIDNKHFFEQLDDYIEELETSPMQG